MSQAERIEAGLLAAVELETTNEAMNWSYTAKDAGTYQLGMAWKPEKISYLYIANSLFNKLSGMKLIYVFITVLFLGSPLYMQGQEWQAKRIINRESQSETNSWFNFVRVIDLDAVPEKAIARVACDSKYWLWVNGDMVVFEGQLKRGPTPHDTYYDEIDIAPHLQTGNNTIAILLWYFGKESFSHNCSGQAGLVFECEAIGLYSDESWQSRLDKAFEHTNRPNPNWRLPESNIRFDARAGNFDWTQPGVRLQGFVPAMVIGEAESPPWNNLVKRPIPMWKDFGVRAYENNSAIPSVSTGEWIHCSLPYNCHVTPILDIEAPAGLTIKMQTDNFDYLGLDRASVRAEYVTKEGRQQYESLGWMNGHVVKYLIPEGVRIHSLTYRETGFGCEFSGYFKCNDPFYEKLWGKALRTLYVNMRDTYMDCPDRERAQWWGDVVNQLGQAFYVLSPEAATLAQKGILELINWQRTDGTLYSPIPEGNWDRELPGQMLASVGYYGFWTYYLNSGDKETIAKVYDGVKRYLDVWQLKPDGTLVERFGEWYWGDWGREVDRQLLFNAWYYLALKGYLNMSELIDNEQEVRQTREKMDMFKIAFNTVFWDGTGYRTSDYEGRYDDRAQALAVVSGLAGQDKYDALLNIFKTSFLASPYMEKYVMEALFVMEEAEYGLERMKNRHLKMVESPYSTLYENFGDGADRAGHGTNNHGWSGGALTILAQYVCGLEPIEPAWKTFRIRPQLGSLEYVETGNETIAGRVSVRVEKNRSGMEINVLVPESSHAIVCIPGEYQSVSLNRRQIYNRRPLATQHSEYTGVDRGYNTFKVGSGTHTFRAK